MTEIKKSDLNINEPKIEELDIEGRRKSILDILNEQGKVKVAELGRMFGISEVTIRNDLDALESNGLLERIHGGALSTYKSYYNMSLHERMDANQDEKKKIAAEAASMISDGDTIFFGSGTTPLYVAREIKDLKNLIIVTNSLSIAQEVGYSKQKRSVVMLGGNVNPEYQFVSGDDTVCQLKNYIADKFILSSDGVSAEFGVTTYHHLEAEINRQMIARAHKTIVVADYSKIGRTSFALIEDIDKIDCLISNKNANKDEIAMIMEKGAEIRLV
ncbi:MAG: DeoR/GlpR family DNA-binding transcription regulator [Saccharofermentanales bacterium]